VDTVSTPIEPRDSDAFAQARLAAIVDSSDDAIVSKTLDGVITSWNAAAERLFGYRADEVVGRSILIIIPEDRAGEEQEVLARVRRGERVHHFETVRRTKDGRLVDISLSVSPVRDAAGRIIGASKIARDVTARRETERTLATTVQRLEVLYHLADAVGRAKDIEGVCEAAIDAITAVGAERAGVLSFDEGGMLRFRAWRNLSQRYREAVEGQSPWAEDALAARPLVVADALAEPALADLRDAIVAEGIRSLAFIPLVNQGRLLGWFMVYHHAVHAWSQAETRLAESIARHVAFGLGRVIADRAIEGLLAREQAARREAELVAEVAQRVNASLDLETTLEHLVEGARELCRADIGRIVVRDPDTGRMRLRHQVGIRWTGYHDQMTIEPGQGSGGLVLLTGRPFRTANYAADPRITGPYMVARDVDGTIAQMVVPIPGESEVAGLLYVDRREARAFTDDDEAVLLRLAGQAGTAIRNSQLFAAERAARAEADRANRGKDQFLAILSHELRTPLNAVLGWARMLRVAQLDDAQRAHAVEVIERNAQLQGRLIADLLDVSRIAVGKMDIERAPIDLVSVVREVADSVAAALEAKGLSLVLELDEAAGEVLGDGHRLQQIVSNLLANAIKFTPDGGRIELRLARHEASARLTIADTGDGIDPAMLSRIFKRFEQADTGTTRRHHGLGLGLAIVRELVELHGGTIRADSEGLGKGATFTIDLPVLAVRGGTGAASVEARREPTDPGTVLRGRRILIVDDQRDAAELVAFVLTRAGAEVRVAGSGEAALRALAAADVDVLVSDIAMPGLDGYELIRHVRAGGRGARTRAIAITAHTGPDVRARVLAAGFDACVTKPLEADALIALLGALGDPPGT
jgi:PAS domain S-box-containing protein